MEISPGELNEKLKDSSVLLLDVRSPAEYLSCHVKGAVNIPLESLNQSVVTHIFSGKSEILTICQSGKRGAMARDRLLSWELANVKNVSGGTVACKSAGLALNESVTAAIPLQRQVMIGAGSMIVLSLILAVVFNTNWLWLTTFVGVGLIVAGFTGFCPMATFLAKMPWNTNVKCNKGCSL